MAKTSKTPRKTQRRKAVHTKEAMPHEPLPAPEVSERDKATEQERPPLDAGAKIAAKTSTVSPAVHHEEITRRVAVGNLLVKMAETDKTPRETRRRKAVRTKEMIPHEPAPEPTVSAWDKMAEHERASLDAVPKIAAKTSTVSPAVHHEEITRRVAMGNSLVKPNSPLAWQFRKLRSVVTNHNLSQYLRSVLITSSLPEEGKTTVALNLSAAIARGLDGSALLIDADLHRKSLSSRLGLESALGLSDVLAAGINIDEITIDTDIDGLTVVPAGSNYPYPAELVESMKMKTLIQQLRGKYKHKYTYIIIDSTPMVPASESQVLSQMVDGVIVVIMAEKTRRDLVKKELKSIDPAKILGVVLNCAEFEASDYLHKYQKYYYGKAKD